MNAELFKDVVGGSLHGAVRICIDCQQMYILDLKNISQSSQAHDANILMRLN
jgi:hypothetical protein